MTPEQQFATVRRLETLAQRLTDAVCAGCQTLKPCRTRPIVTEQDCYTGPVCDDCWLDN